MSLCLEKARKANKEGRYADVLATVGKVYRILGQRNELAPFPAGMQAADKLLEQVGQSLWENRRNQTINKAPLQGDLIIASSLFVTGGHTAAIRDLAINLPEPPVSLWITQPIASGAKKNSGEAIRRTGLQSVVRTFGFGSTLQNAKDLIDALAELKPARVFLSHFSSDCAAVLVAAAALKMGSRVCLLHFADKNPTSGLYLQGIDIFDFTPRSCAFTRDMLKLRSAWLPLTCPDPGPLPPHFLAKGRLTTAVSGSRGKVKAIHNPGYPELVSNVLQATSGYHVHIGPLSKKMLHAIRLRLFFRGIPRERFKWIAQAPTLVQALREHNVDLVINTYPAGGARTAVEVMAAGIPMVWNSPTLELDAIRAQTKYAGALVWRDIGQLVSCLGALDRGWLEEQGTAARKFYEENHLPQNWQAALRDLDAAYDRRLPEGYDASLFTQQILEHFLDKDSLRKKFLGKIF